MRHHIRVVTYIIIGLFFFNKVRHRLASVLSESPWLNMREREAGREVREVKEVKEVKEVYDRQGQIL